MGTAQLAVSAMMDEGLSLEEAQAAVLVYRVQGAGGLAVGPILPAIS